MESASSEDWEAIENLRKEMDIKQKEMDFIDNKENRTHEEEERSIALHDEIVEMALEIGRLIGLQQI